MRRSRLDVVARLARLREQAAMKSLADGLRQVQTARANLSAVESAIDVGHADARPGGAPVPAGQLRIAARRVEALQLVRLDRRARLDASLETLETSRGALATARLRTRAIDHAIERRRERERLEAARVETKQLDEQARGLRALREANDEVA